MSTDSLLWFHWKCSIIKERETKIISFKTHTFWFPCAGITQRVQSINTATSFPGTSPTRPQWRERALSLFRHWGRVGEDPENEVDNTDVKPATAVAIPIKTQWWFLPLIIHQIFFILPDWSKCVMWLNIHRLKLEKFWVMFPNFLNHA